MKRNLVLFFLVLGAFWGLSSSKLKPRKNARLFVSRIKYYDSKLLLKENGTFKQTQHSCTYSFSCSGNWTQNGDTIALHRETFKSRSMSAERYAERSDTLLKLSEDTLVYLWGYQRGFGSHLIIQEKQSKKNL